MSKVKPQDVQRAIMRLAIAEKLTVDEVTQMLLIEALAARRV